MIFGSEYRSGRVGMVSKERAARLYDELKRRGVSDVSIEPDGMGVRYCLEPPKVQEMIEEEERKNEVQIIP